MNRSFKEIGKAWLAKVFTRIWWMDLVLSAGVQQETENMVTMTKVKVFEGKPEMH